MVGDDNQLRIDAGERGKPELALAARYDQTNVCVVEAVCAACVANGVDYLLFCPRHIEGDSLGGAEKSVDVFVELEYIPVVEADTFKDTVAVEKTVVEHRHFCVVLVVIFSVYIYFHCVSFYKNFSIAGVCQP